MANDKIAIVGTRGCGKTVLLAVLTHRFKDKTEEGFQIIPNNFDAVRFTSDKWGDLGAGQWPAPTPDEITPPLYQWKLCNGKKSKLMTTSDIAGEAWKKFILDSVNNNFQDSETELSNWEKIKEEWKTIIERKPEELINAHLKTAKELLNQASGIFLLLNLKEIIDREEDYETAMYLPIALANYMSSIKRQHIPVTLVLTQTDQYSFAKEKLGDWDELVKEYIPWMPVQFKEIIPTAAVGAVKQEMIDGNYRACPAPDFPSQGLEELYKNLWDTMSQAGKRAQLETTKRFLIKDVPILFMLWVIYILSFLISPSVTFVWCVFFLLIGVYACVKITKWLHSKR
jgi:GTPase SAR1 family protein